jgi:hypothetical protein
VKTGSRSALMMVGMLFTLPLLASCTASPSDLSATVATDPITVTCKVTENGTYPNITLTTAAESSQINDPNIAISKVTFIFESIVKISVDATDSTVTAGNRVFKADLTTGQARFVTAVYYVDGVEVKRAISTGECPGFNIRSH